MTEAWRRVFGDLDPETFDATIRDRKVWHRPAEGGFTDLISTAAIGRLIDTARLRHPNVSMADGRANRPTAAVPSDDYLNRDDSADPLRIRTLMSKGATLVLSQVEEYHAPLGAFCRALETVFWHRIQTNLYLTPPGDAQGFRPHWDSHEVIVLQVEGTKTWNLYDHAPLEQPTRATPYDRNLHAPPGPPDRTLVLQPGDVLYLPRGAIHDAQTTDTLSLHVTVGLLAPNWADALRALIDDAERSDARLRHRFAQEREDAADALPAVLARLGADGLGTRLRARMVAGYLDSSRPSPARGLLPASPGPEDRLRLAPDALMFVTEEPEGLTLHARGASAAITPAVAEALRLLDEGTASTLAELAAASGAADPRELAPLWQTGVATWG